MKTRKVKLIRITESHKKEKKWDAIFEIDDKEKIVPFGAAGMSDFTKHKDKTRKQRYLDRHSARENWDQPDTPGALSRWILWNKPTLKGSVTDFKKRFKV